MAKRTVEEIFETLRRQIIVAEKKFSDTHSKEAESRLKTLIMRYRKFLEPKLKETKEWAKRFEELYGV